MQVGLLSSVSERDVLCSLLRLSVDADLLLHLQKSMRLYSNSNKTAQEEGVSMAISRPLWRRHRKEARPARILHEKIGTFLHVFPS